MSMREALYFRVELTTPRTAQPGRFGSSELHSAIDSS